MSSSSGGGCDWATDSSSGAGNSGSSGWGGQSGTTVEPRWEPSDGDTTSSARESDDEENFWHEEPGAGRRSVEYYKRRWGRPLYEGAGITVGEAVFTYLCKKVEDCEGDTASDKAYRLLHEVILPKPNLFPPSLHILRRLAGVEEIDKYERHVYEENHYVWEHARRECWSQHKDDECPICRAEGRTSKRFKVLPGGKLVPSKVSASAT